MDEVLHGSSKASRPSLAAESEFGRSRVRIGAADRHRGHESNVGLVRYDAFEDVGGRCRSPASWTTTDERRHDVDQQATRHEVYAKPVSGATAPTVHRSRKREAIRQALSRADGAVTAT
jgi:hypothetical protein